MKKAMFRILAAAGLAAAAGCANYQWKSRVPEELRTVAVPVFHNLTKATELGPLTTQHVLREFQREGTFSIRRSGESSIEVQGTIEAANTMTGTYDRNLGASTSEYRYVAIAKVAIVNKESGKVLRDNVTYKAETSFLVQGDLLTARRNAAERLASDLARQIVDDVVSYPYNRAQ